MHTRPFVSRRPNVKRAYAVLMIALFVPACTTGGSGHPTWSKSFGADQYEEFFGAASTVDQLVLTGMWNGGEEGSYGRDGDLWVVSLDGVGNVLWQRSLGVQNVPGAGEGAPPMILDLAVDNDAVWLSGVSASGQATVLRTNLSGQVEFSVDIEPHEPGRFEQAMAVSPTAGGAVAAIWAYDTVIETTVEGHPDYPEVENYEVGRWRMRVVRVDDDGTVRWARTYDNFFEEREPEAVAITGLSDGGAVVALSLESTLAVARLGGDNTPLWTVARSGNDDANGIVELPDGSVVVYGDSTAFSFNARQGFATRFAPGGDVLWHERYGAVDRFGAGTLACPPAATNCHLAFAGVDFGAIIPPTAHVVRVELDGSVRDTGRDVIWGFPRSTSYDPASDTYLISAHRWGQFNATVLDGSLAEVSVESLGDTGVVDGEVGVVASRGEGPVYYYSASRSFLRAYESNGSANFTVPFDTAVPRRETGMSVLARADGTIVAGRNAAGQAWGVSFDAFGNERWQRSWAMPVGVANQLAPAADGGFWLGAENQLLRLDAQGEPQWRRFVDHSPKVFPSEPGVLVAAGDTVMSLNAAGEPEWSYDYATGMERISWDSAHRFGDGWTLVGRTSDEALVILDVGANGQPGTGTTLRTTTGGFQRSARIAVVDGLRVVASTFKPDDGETDVVLVALTGDNEVAWVRRYGGLLRDEMRTLIAPATGGLLAGGASSSLGDAFDGWVLRLDSQGLVGVEGACQALLTSPGVEVAAIAATAETGSTQLYEAAPATATPTNLPMNRPELAIARQCAGSAPDPGTGGRGGAGGQSGAGGQGGGGAIDCSDVTPGEGFFGQACRNDGDCLDGLPCCTSTDVSEACGTEVSFCSCI